MEYGTSLHPGVHLKAMIAEREMSQVELAYVLQQAVTGINLIIAQKRGISAEMSKALGAALDCPENYFADLQTAYDIATADPPAPEIATRAEILRQYPVREMIRRGWLSSKYDLQTELARFFELSDPSEIPYMPHSAKKTLYEERNISPEQIAWLFRVRQIARTIVIPPFSHIQLKRAVQQMKRMLTAPEEARHVPRLLADAGVRFVIVEALPGGKIDGVAFWLSELAPVIGMSLRFDRIDNFWFVLRHEIEHILLGHGAEIAMVDAEVEGEVNPITAATEEQVANAAAADFCVPASKMDSFIARKRPFYHERDLLAFAAIHHVHPGLAIGQLQRKTGRYDYLRKYQVRIRHCVLPSAYAEGWGQSVPIGGQ